jgi:hypothetical protein
VVGGALFGLLLLFLCLASCNKESPTQVPQSTQSPKVSGTLYELFQGIWRNISDDATLKYMVFDSVSATESDWFDRGLNFRDRFTISFVLDSLHIWRINSLEGASIRYWYRFVDDTLTISYDSLGGLQNRFVKHSPTALFDNWTERLVWTDFTTVFRNITSWVMAIAYSDSGWFVLCKRDNSGSRLYRTTVTGDSISATDFSNIQAVDVVGSDLWVAGHLYIQKRRVSDNSIIAQFDLSQYFDNYGLDDGVRGIAVENDIIYLSVENFSNNSFAGRIFRFRTNGQLIDVRPTNSGITDLAVVSGRLWCTTESGHFFELDIASGAALHSYYLVFENHFRYQGIAIKNGTLQCADFIANYLRVYEVPLPPR